MSKSYRSSLITSTSALAIALSVTVTASAQDSAQQAQASRLEEITVTARRVEENIQRVPLSVVAVAEEKLTDMNIVDLKDFNKVAPGFLQPGTDTGAFAFMRGLQGIAPYFADAPFTLAGEGQYFDIGNVQVLKGPQGTLFGQSSAAGAIVINPRKPTDTLEGFAQVIVGDYGRRTIGGAINVPVVEDKLLIRLAAQSFYRKGYVTDPSTGKDYYDENDYVFRPSFIIRPTENVESYTMFQYYYSRNNGRTGSFQFQNYNPTGLWVTRPMVGQANADRILAQWYKNPYETVPLAQVAGFSGERTRAIFIVNSTRWDILDNLALTNIFSYAQRGSRTAGDPPIDGGFFGSPANDPRAVATRTSALGMNPTWSNETKFTGTLFDDMLNFTVGTFHTASTYRPDISWGNTGGVLTASISKGNARSPAWSRAVFAQSDVDLGRVSDVLEGLTFTAGYRYTWNAVRQARNDLAILPGVPTEQLKAARTLYGVAHFANANWLAGLRYQINPDTMVFVTASKGVTTGQVNVVNPPGFQVTQPESLEQIEGGLKSTFFLGDMQFRTNASVYYGWYSNIQVSATRLAQINLPPAPPQSLVVSENAAKGLVRGVDAEITVLPTDWLEFGFNGAYNKNKYTYWPIITNNVVTGDRSNTLYLGAPRLKYNLSATFHVPMDEEMGKLSLSANYQHTGYKVYTVLQLGTYAPFTYITQANGYGPLAEAASGGAKAATAGDFPYHNIDVSAKWSDPWGISGLTATLAINNITKNIATEGNNYSYFATGALGKDPATPRMFTLGLKYDF